jgi:transposase
LEEAAGFAPEQVVGLSRELAAAQHQVDLFKHQLDWFKRQLFGQKSERCIIGSAGAQLNLGELIDQGQAQAPQKQHVIAAHTRSVATKNPEAGDESVPFFDETRVPVETIELAAPQAAGLAPDEFEVISYKDSYRLAQRPGSYVVLKYRRPVIKLRASQAIVCAPAPMSVIEGSRAEVSFVAGALIDKFAYHLPLYRQHQRLGDCGIAVSRPWLTQIAHQGASLLEPIYEAQFASIRQSRVKAMDETPIKAGHAGPGKMKGAYFWPVYGEHDEVCFPFFESRRAEHVEQALGLKPAQGAVLLSDGYSAYAHYAAKTGSRTHNAGRT